MGLVYLYILAAAVVSYLLGSLNFAIIVSNVFYKKDIRTFGSGNAGMTNVLRTFGKGAAALTILGDIGKGVVSVLISKWFFTSCLALNVPSVAYISCICAVLGHLFPVYFKFKGGKGVSVAAGAIAAIEPILILPLVALFIIVVLCTKIVSLASILCALFYPAVTFGFAIIQQQSTTYIITVTLLALLPAALVVFMHKENIKRLIAGTEYKFGQKKDK